MDLGTFFALLGVGIVSGSVGWGGHATLALWYTRRQRVRFQADLTETILPEAEARIIASVTEKVKTDVVPAVVQGVSGWWGATVRHAGDRARTAGLNEQDAMEIAELSGVVGQDTARKLVAGEKILRRLRDRRNPQPSQPPPATPPAAGPIGAGTPPGGELHPNVVAALKRAGVVFKTEPEVSVAEAPKTA